ncbi:MAG: hypothetical protein ACYDIA_24490, partial [Candidatus Humimicrobiaceae bacterium]
KQSNDRQQGGGIVKSIKELSEQLGKSNFYLYKHIDKLGIQRHKEHRGKSLATVIDAEGERILVEHINSCKPKKKYFTPGVRRMFLSLDVNSWNMG